VDKPLDPELARDSREPRRRGVNSAVSASADPRMPPMK